MMSLRLSAAWFVGVLAVGVVAARFGGYLRFEQPVAFGQSLNIFIAYAAFVIAALLWVRLDRRPRLRGLPAAFLTLMGIAWFIHLTLYRWHGDAFDYTALLYVPILLMLLLKPPAREEAWAAVLAFAWATAIALVTTRALEMVGLLDIKVQNPDIVEFDSTNYFLPFNDLLGIDGRWPGPFGHNGDTAMMAALLIVIAVAHWTRASWVFVAVGAGTFLITDGRASIGAAAAGVLVIAIFTNEGRLGRIPRSRRVIVGLIVLVIGAFGMYLRPTGLTGRQTIWPAFLELWYSSPIVGVGGRGIAEAGGIATQFGHAHSLYIDELARWGLAGFVSQFVALGVGVAIAVMAARIGRPGALGVLLAYFITGITEPRNNWIQPSVTGFLVILMVLVAAAELREQRPSRAAPALATR